MQNLDFQRFQDRPSQRVTHRKQSVAAGGTSKHFLRCSRNAVDALFSPGSEITSAFEVCNEGLLVPLSHPFPSNRPGLDARFILSVLAATGTKPWVRRKEVPHPQEVLSSKIRLDKVARYLATRGYTFSPIQTRTQISPRDHSSLFTV